MIHPPDSVLARLLTMIDTEKAEEDEKHHKELPHCRYDDVNYNKIVIS